MEPAPFPFVAQAQRLDEQQRYGAGARPVLAFEYETIVDGARLARPVNYSLVRTIPPEGTLQRETGRPYIIIDPRAGHGSGIGGFKDESEVGRTACSRQPNPSRA